MTKPKRPKDRDPKPVRCDERTCNWRGEDGGKSPTFLCMKCRSLRCWCQGADDDRPNWCNECRSKYGPPRKRKPSTARKHTGVNYDHSALLDHFPARKE